jgi:hypothetical protein
VRPRKPAPDLPEHAIARLAVVEAVLDFDQPIRIEEDLHRIGKVEASLGEAGVALGVVPLEFQIPDLG